MVKIKVQLPEKDCDAKAEFIENLQTHGFIKENISLGEFSREETFAITVSFMRRRVQRHVKRLDCGAASD